ncbi:hypothetical protein DRO64_04650 [Candidatus Bathyarchaeota archaeon]|nr:MAG: hypothetical protein DRO64_04650 [Candidatus Bathyarchaeota archaeon]
MDGYIFSGGYILPIALTSLAIISGLTVKLLMPSLGIRMRRTDTYEELIGLMLIRRRLPNTFIRILTWNLMVSFLVIISGALTFGTLPLVWAFLNLGLSFPCLRLFRVYLHLWAEETANMLSVILGVWVGLNFQILMGAISQFMWMLTITFGLYALSALLETIKIHGG